MLGTVVTLVVMLLLPGMQEPKISRQPMASYQDCLSKVAEVEDGLIKHNGEEYKYFVGCEVTSEKSNPA